MEAIMDIGEAIETRDLHQWNLFFSSLLVSCQVSDVLTLRRNFGFPQGVKKRA
jgi:hypothetical protein